MVGLQDASRAPKVIPHRTPRELVEIIVAERKEHPTWGPKKVKEVLERRLERTLPAASTVGDILVRNGLVTPRKRRPRHRATPTGLRDVTAPNDVWCIDYKGQFQLGDNRSDGVRARGLVVFALRGVRRRSSPSSARMPAGVIRAAADGVAGRVRPRTRKANTTGPRKRETRSPSTRTG